MIAQADGGEGAEGAEEKGAKAEEAAEAAAGTEEVSTGDTHVRGVEARAAAAAGVLAEVWARGAPRYAPHPEVAECALTCVRLRGAGEAAALHVQAVLDPLSAMARWAAPLLLALRAQLKLSLTVVLAPQPELRRLPLARLYRMAVQLDPLRPAPPAASFEQLRVAQTLTLHMAPPEGWLLRLRAVSDGVDTDNLQLRTLPEGQEGVSASYTLSSILLSGGCAHPAEAQPPEP